MPVSRSRTAGRSRPSALRTRLGVAVATLALALTAVGGAGVASATTPTATVAPSSQQAHPSANHTSAAHASTPTRVNRSLAATRSVRQSNGRPGTPPSSTTALPPRTPNPQAATTLPADTPQACSGSLTPHTVVGCDQPEWTESYTVDAPSAPDVLVVRAQWVSTGYLAPVTVFAPDGSTVTCDPTGSNVTPTSCRLTQGGRYTVQVSAESVAFTVAVDLLLSDSVCPQLSTSFASTDTTTSVPAGDVGTCFRTQVDPNHVVRTTVFSGTVWTSLLAFDATGSQACFVHSSTCTLTGASPYRWLVVPLEAGADTATFRIDDLTDPQGCDQVSPQHFSSAPPSSPGDCKTFSITTAGRYIVDGASAQGTVNGVLYDASGHPACTNAGFGCQLDPGTYALVTDLGPSPTATWALTVVAAADTSGCTTTSDTGFADGAASGTLDHPGEVGCRTLPTASGARLYAFDQVPASAAQVASARPAAVGSSFSPPLALLDATGAPQCPEANLVQAVCALTGQAPFRLVVVNQDATSSYQVLLQRTDSQAGCPLLKATGFSTAFGATVTLDPSHDVGCLSIPADQHSTGEMIDYTDGTNTLNAALDVYDPSGTLVCTSYYSSLVPCSFAAGVSYTVLPLSGSLTAPDTFHVVRRDVSSSAACSAPVSTTVGGPSTTAVLASTTDARCLRIAASPSDQIYADVRARGVSGTGAVRFVTDSAGKLLCFIYGMDSCRVSGSSAYQVVVVAAGYAGVPIPAHIDVWRVGTSAGWAPECVRNAVPAGGVGLHPVSFSETTTGYCAVVHFTPQQQVGIDVTPSTGTGTPQLLLSDVAVWGDQGTAGRSGLCAGTDTTYTLTCTNPSTTQPVDGILLLTPDTAPVPVSVSFQGICLAQCPTTPPPTSITSISPATGSNGARPAAVVRGTGLTLATRLELLDNGSPVNGSAYVGTQSVSADGTSMSVVFSTDVPPGRYDLHVSGTGYEGGVPSATYLPDAWTVTAATPVASQLLTPIAPTRFLDTRAGLGAPKARVASTATVRLAVAGVKGVPSTGVGALVLNLTAVAPTKGGYVTAYPDGGTRPTVSNLNFAAGQTVANQVVVPVTNGVVDLYNGSAGPLDLLADVTGYYRSTTGSGLTALAPVRVLDTRSGIGTFQHRVAAGGTVPLSLAGVGGLPTSGVTAVVLTVTEVNPTAAGYVTVYPYGASRPVVSNINFPAGQTVPNLVTVPVSSDGKVLLYNGSPGTVDLVADLAGYYSAGGGVLHTVTPVRGLDTRTGLGHAGGTVLPGTAAVLSVADLPFLPTSSPTAMLLNVTVTNPSAAGYLTVAPDGQPVPTASNLNFAKGQTVAGLVLVPVVNGQIDFFNGGSGSVDVVADVEGYVDAPTG